MASAIEFKGRRFTASDLGLVSEIVESCSGLSRTELAETVCELLRWKRPSGSLKARECWELLEQLESRGLLRLPDKRPWQRREPPSSVGRAISDEQARQALEGTAGDFEPIVLDEVCSPEQRRLYRELVGRHHYLGHTVPFGAHLRYLVYVSRPERAVVGCVQFSSPAWRMAARDAWIGWDEQARRRNLQRVVSNSRFLLVPWARIKNLASVVLSLSARRLAADWYRRYRVYVLLLETLVDTSRYSGTCYRAANWICLGETAGRGRMDRHHLRHGAAVKTVLVYPLVKDAAQRLRG